MSLVITALSCSFSVSAATQQENLQNAALGKPVTESFNDGGRRSAPAYVVTDGSDIPPEGSRFAFWRATPTSETGDAYIIIDLEDKFSCTGAALMLQGTGDSVTVALSYSADGDLWKEYGSLKSDSITAAEKTVLEYDLPISEKIRFVKFSVSAINKIFAVIEAEVCGVPYPDFDTSADITNIALGITPTASSILNNDSNLQPTRVTDGTNGAWAWISGDEDNKKTLDIDLGAWYNIEKIDFAAMAAGQGNDGENSRRLINIYGSATGEFEDEKIKLMDIGLDVMAMSEVKEHTVALKNLVRYIRVTPKSRTQFGDTYSTSRFGFTEIKVYANKADAYYMAEVKDETFMTDVIMKPTVVQMITAADKDNLLKKTEFNLYCGMNTDDNMILSAELEAGTNPYFETKAESFGKYIRYESISESGSVNRILVFYKEKDDNNYLTIDNVRLDGTEGLNNASLTVKADILNNGTKKITGTAVAVLYNEQLCAVKTATAVFEGEVDIKGEISVTVENSDFGENMAGYKLKVFFVENGKAINPYRTSETFR